MKKRNDSKYDREIRELVSKKLERDITITLEKNKMYLTIFSFSINLIFLLFIYFLLIYQNSYSTSNLVLSNLNQELLKHYELCKVYNISESCNIINSTNYPTLSFNLTKIQIESSFSISNTISQPFLLFIFVLLAFSIGFMIYIERVVNKISSDLINYEKSNLEILLEKKQKINEGN